MEPALPLSDQPESTTIALEITIGGERVRFDVTVPTGPADRECLLPFMRSLIAVSSAISQEQAQTAGKSVSCRAGCGICCRQRVPIAEFEAHRLRRLVESMPEPRRSTIIERFREAERRVKEATVPVSLDSDVPLSPEEMTRRSANYFRLMIPCPFLEDESCSIYEDRPLKCREYLVTSPAEYCATPESGNVEGLPQPLSVYMTTLFLGADEKRDGLPWVSLSDLLTWTDTHAPTPPTHTGPELLHEFMTKLMQRQAPAAQAQAAPEGAADARADAGAEGAAANG